MTINIKKHSNNISNFKEDYSMEIKFVKTQQTYSFDMMLPGGGFFGGEQTDVLPGGGFHANGEELPGGFFDRGQIEERPDDGDHRQHNKYSLYKGDRTNERIRLWN